MKKQLFFFQKAIEINPNYLQAHNNLGATLHELGKTQKAINYFQKAIKINPNYAAAHWNIHSFSTGIDEALKILKKLYRIDNNYIKAKFINSALEGFK